MPFDIPNLRVENGPAEAHVRIGWLRSVANNYHAFAVQSSPTNWRMPPDAIRSIICST